MAAWKCYVAGDESTLDKYHHLFPPQHNPRLPFVSFQQVVLKGRVATSTEEEISAIDAFIDAHFEDQKELRERPWNALKVDDAQPEIDLERQYLKE